MKKAFTLIEILVVATIIGLLALAGLVSYSQFMRQSRDAKRKADIELIRSALEMYRSTVNLYPTSSPLGNFATTSITDSSGNVYISKLPTDPQSTGRYYYLSDGNIYTLGVRLESGDVSNCASPCSDTGANCNYCMGPYGQL